MLDDLQVIHDRDPQDALGIAEKQWQQLQYEYEVEIQPHADSIKNIVFAGMGGSALYALVAKVWPGFDRPFEVVRNYDLPAYVGEDSLVFVSSYSGNTEETISALHQAEGKGAGIIVITAGGQLADLAREKNYPLLLLPGGLQPRHALWYGLKAILTATDKLGLTDGKADELAAQAEFLKDAIQAWLPTVPTDKNAAKQIAQECIGKSPVIYAGPKLAPAAYKWKISFNENAKHIAWTNEFPEFNHNEFMGWTKQPVDKPYTIIDLRSSAEHPRVQKRFEVSARLLSGMRPAPIIVTAQGDPFIQELMFTIALGDFVTLYTALLSNVNPTPVELIENLKKSLDE
ncbi:MAG: bifunctional phosphoglucose/phosphomannose isomerase [Candidatus Saccharibacteria bacterium]|nr:bifunctional phosphoglucose/phosphomannose isomerase [Candidatus Saccharibacteria bacterium]